jgi:hypothetical protein
MKTNNAVILILLLAVLPLLSMASADDRLVLPIGGAYVQIDSSGQAIDQISPYTSPAIGKIYLLVHITITNHGYADVYTNPNFFQVEVNHVKYGYDGASYNLDQIGKPILDTNAHLGDGGQISGYLVFQIPADTTNWTLIFDEGYPPKVVRSNTNATSSGGWVYQ